MTTILAIGDPHFQVTNIPAVEQFIRRVIEVVEEHQPDLIIILGDVLHNHESLHVTPLNKAYHFIREMKNRAPTYVIVGNHDASSNQIFLTDTHWMNAMKDWENVTIVDQVVRVQQFMLCPYVPPGRFKEALATHEDEWSEMRAIFAHQEFSGCKMGAIISVEGDKWSESDPPVISGHIHDRQRPQENIYYTGSSMQHAFGESGRKTIALLTFPDDGSAHTVEEVELGLPQKKIVYLDVNELEDYQAPTNDDEIKLTVSGSYDDFKALKKTDKYQEILQQGVKVVFKPKKKRKKKRSDDETKEGENDEPGNLEEELQSTSTKFHQILSDLVNVRRDPHLLQTYELIVNNREIGTDTIFL